MSNLIAKQQLTPQQLALVESEMANKRKNPTLAIVLALCLGAFGAHRFYLDQGSRGVAMLVTTGVIFLLTIMTLGFGVFLFLIPGIWSLVDCFSMSNEVERKNDEIERLVIQSVGGYVPVPVAVPLPGPTA